MDCFSAHSLETLAVGLTDWHLAQAGATSAAGAAAGTSLGRSLGKSPGKSLIDERFDHDSCGVGFVASVEAAETHTILEQALTALARLAHRGAVAADGKSSDGVGIMTAVPRALLLEATGLTLAEKKTLFVVMIFLPAE